MDTEQLHKLQDAMLFDKDRHNLKFAEVAERWSLPLDITTRFIKNAQSRRANNLRRAKLPATKPSAPFVPQSARDQKTRTEMMDDFFEMAGRGYDGKPCHRPQRRDKAAAMQMAG